MTVLFLNDLVLSLRALSTGLSGKLQRARLLYDNSHLHRPGRSMSQSLHPTVPRCFLPVPQEVAVRFKGRDKHILMSLIRIRKALLPRYTLLPSPTKK